MIRGMPADDPPKTAYELAMERLRRKDADQGVDERPLTSEQKAQIADIKQVYAAKLAEIEILHKSRLAAVWEPEERQKVEAELKRETQRLQEERERKLSRIRDANTR